MPFGLKCSSNSFIRAVHQILQPVNTFCDGYVDDLATYTVPNDFSLHLQHIRLFLLEIRKSGLTLNLNKAAGFICRSCHWRGPTRSGSRQNCRRGENESAMYEKGSPPADWLLFLFSDVH